MEKTVGESLAVPGESYTIPELFARTQAGIPLETSVNVHDDVYANDGSFDTFIPEADFDISEAHQIAQEAAETIRAAKNSKLKEAEEVKASSEDVKAVEDKAKDDSDKATPNDDSKAQN